MRVTSTRPRPFPGFRTRTPPPPYHPQPSGQRRWRRDDHLQKASALSLLSLTFHFCRWPGYMKRACHPTIKVVHRLPRRFQPRLNIELELFADVCFPLFHILMTLGKTKTWFRWGSSKTKPQKSNQWIHVSKFCMLSFKAAHCPITLTSRERKREISNNWQRPIKIILCRDSQRKVIKKTKLGFSFTRRSLNW